MIDSTTFRPPPDPTYQTLIAYALAGDLPVYGAVIETAKTSVRRFDDRFRPENTIEGREVLESLMQDWKNGRPIQPWLYIRDDQYICADDYFFMAILERGQPPSFAAQILGRPLRQGLLQETAPIPVPQLRSMFGLAV